jgi:hypothetical protein
MFTAMTTYITTKTNELVDWVNSIPKAVGDYIGGVVKDIEKWVYSIVPGIVEAMLDFLKPIVKPIQYAVGWLGQIAGIITGSHPEEPAMTEHKETIAEKQKAIDEIVKKI